MAPLSSPLDSFRWYAGDREQQAIYWICAALLSQFGLAGAVLVSGINAPYGRYNQAVDKAERGPVMRLLAACDVPARLAWVLQECPNLLAAVACWLTGSAECKGNLGNRISLLCFATHYVNRTLVYPLRMQGSKPVPLPVMLMAMGFCSVNGYIQCRSLTRFLVLPADAWHMPLGVALWGCGLYINMDSDSILRNLRKPGEVGYKIPHGGLFEYVSGANFFGEILEWLGYALAAGGALPAATFAFCTALNIGPRALAHHRWYLEKFQDEYPKERKALIPFLL